MLAGKLKIVKCLECGKKFPARVSETLRGRGKFCSKSCSGKSARRKRIGDQFGINNPSWKDGISKEYSRYKRIYNQRHPEKVKANRAVYNALKSGKITKGKCNNCGSSKDIHGHHENYSKPLDVIWLCAKCHRVRHGKSK